MPSGEVLNPDKFKKRRRVVREPYEVKLSKEEVDRIAKEMSAEVFATGTVHGNKRIEDGYLYSKRLLLRVCRGRKEDGSIWTKAPGFEQDEPMEVLAKRLRIFGYDLDTGMAVSKLKASVNMDDFMPDDAAPVDKRIKYGSRIGAILNTEEAKLYKAFKKKISAEYPELCSASDELGIEILATLHLRIMRAQLEIGGNQDGKISKDLEAVAGLYKTMTESLGISGRQRFSKMDTDSGSVSDLVKAYKERLERYATEKHKRYIQECMLVLQAYRRGDMSEIDVVRLVKISVKEVRDLLIANKIDPDLIGTPGSEDNTQQEGETEANEKEEEEDDVEE